MPDGRTGKIRFYPGERKHGHCPFTLQISDAQETVEDITEYDTEKCSSLSYYLNYMDENKLHMDDVYQMKYARNSMEHFTDFLIWLKAGEHSREENPKLPNNETCNAYLKEVFRFYTFMEREYGQSESLKVLSDAQRLCETR